MNARCGPAGLLSKGSELGLSAPGSNLSPTAWSFNLGDQIEGRWERVSALSAAAAARPRAGDYQDSGLMTDNYTF
jgi:hypothetical protein